MEHIKYHISSLKKLDWDKFSLDMFTINSFQGSDVCQRAAGKAVEKFCNGKEFFFVNSGTAALELALMALDLQEGSEVILPSYTFSSCANAVLRSNGIPVFCDISLPKLHITLSNIKNVVSDKTKVIMVVEYGGIRSDLKEIKNFCDENNIILLLDSAQTFGATGALDCSDLSDFVCYSFHDTKVISCGEGGLLVVNNENYIDTVATMFEKGTNRRDYFRNKVDKYEWRSVGSSFILSDINLRILMLILNRRQEIISEKIDAYNVYYNYFSDISNQALVSHSPSGFTMNGHIFWLLFQRKIDRERFQICLADQNVETTTHYVPLHTAPASKNMKLRCDNDMQITNSVGSGLLRLPVISKETSEQVIDRISCFF